MTSFPLSSVEELKQQLQDKGVKYAMASYVDIHGVIKGKFVPIAHLGQMLRGSELYTGAALDGVPQQISDNEVAAMPDPATATQCSWNRDLAWFASDLYLDGKPFDACSRGILKRQTEAAAALGYTFNLGIETEFFLFKDTPDGGFAPISERDDMAKPCYDPRLLMDNLPIVDELVQAMNEMGWGVYSFDHEDANGQFETDFKYTDALGMADRFVFFRMMANEIARKHGAFATFMPKPSANRTGSGAHYNMSLADIETGKNLFEVDGEDPYGCGVTPLAYHFIAGVLKHAKAICAVIAPTVNSYKRLIRKGAMSGSTWAPVFCCYGNNNRTNMLRIPVPGRAGRMPRRRHRLQPLPRCSDDSRRRPRRHPRQAGARSAASREHVRLQRKGRCGHGHRDPPAHPQRSHRRVRGRSAVAPGVRRCDV